MVWNCNATWVFLWRPINAEMEAAGGSGVRRSALKRAEVVLHGSDGHEQGCSLGHVLHSALGSKNSNNFKQLLSCLTLCLWDHLRDGIDGISLVSPKF